MSLRVIRSASIIGILWALFGLVAGILAESYTSWLARGWDVEEHSHLRVPLMFAAWAFISGIGFSILLGRLERGKDADSLSWWRSLAWGVLGALPLPALLPIIYSDATFGLQDAIIVGSLTIAVGAGAAATTLWLSRWRPATGRAA